MIKRISIIAAICALACCAVLACGCASSSSYTPEAKTPAISTPTIGEEGVLRVGVDTNNPPLAGQASKIIGIDVDIAAAIADELGLKLSIVEVGSDPLSALKEGKVDMVLGLDSGDKDDDLWMSNAYLSTGIALFSTNASAEVPTKDKTPKIACQDPSLSSWAVLTQYGSDCTVSEETLKAAFADLSAGKVDYVAADAVIGSYAAQVAKMDVYIVALMQKASGYYAGCLASNTALQETVDQVLTSMQTGGIISVIEKKWLGTNINLTTVPLTTDKATSENSSEKSDEKKTE